MEERMRQREEKKIENDDLDQSDWDTHKLRIIYINGAVEHVRWTHSIYEN